MRPACMKLAKTLLVALAFTAFPAWSAETRDPDEHFFALNTGDFKAEAADARRAGKKAIMVMFEQDGCPGCFYMRHNVLNRVDVQKFYDQNFANFSLNIYGSIPIRDFAGRNFTEKSFSKSVDIIGTPTFLFYDLDGKEAMRFVGPLKEVSDFMLLGQFVASGAYKTSQFAEYKQQRTKKKGS